MQALETRTKLSEIQQSIERQKAKEIETSTADASALPAEIENAIKGINEFNSHIATLVSSTIDRGTISQYAEYIPALHDRIKFTELSADRTNQRKTIREMQKIAEKNPLLSKDTEIQSKFKGLPENPKKGTFASDISPLQPLSNLLSLLLSSPTLQSAIATSNLQAFNSGAGAETKAACLRKEEYSRRLVSMLQQMGEFATYTGEELVALQTQINGFKKTWDEKGLTALKSYVSKEYAAEIDSFMQQLAIIEQQIALAMLFLTEHKETSPKVPPLAQMLLDPAGELIPATAWATICTQHSDLPGLSKELRDIPDLQQWATQLKEKASEIAQWDECNKLLKPITDQVKIHSDAVAASIDSIKEDVTQLTNITNLHNEWKKETRTQEKEETLQKFKAAANAYIAKMRTHYSQQGYRDDTQIIFFANLKDELNGTGTFQNRQDPDAVATMLQELQEGGQQLLTQKEQEQQTAQQNPPPDSAEKNFQELTELTAKYFLNPKFSDASLRQSMQTSIEAHPKAFVQQTAAESYAYESSLKYVETPEHRTQRRNALKQYLAKIDTTPEATKNAAVFSSLQIPQLIASEEILPITELEEFMQRLAFKIIQTHFNKEMNQSDAGTRLNILKRYFEITPITTGILLAKRTEITDISLIDPTMPLEKFIGVLETLKSELNQKKSEEYQEQKMPGTPNSELATVIGLLIQHTQTRRIKYLETVNEQLLQHIAKMQALVGDIQTKSEDALKKAIEAKEKLANGIIDPLQQNITEIERLQKILEEMQRNANTLLQGKEQAEARIRKFAADQSSANLSVSSPQPKTPISASYETITALIAEMRKKQDDLIKEREDLIKETQNYFERRISAINTELATHAAEIESLQKQDPTIAKLPTEIEQLQQQKSDQLAKLAEIKPPEETQITTNTAERERLTKELQTQQEKLKELGKSLFTEGQDIRAISQQLRTTENTIKTLTTSLETLTSSVEKATQAITAKKLEINPIEQAIAVIDSQIDAKNISLSTSIATAAAKKQQLSPALEKLLTEKKEVASLLEKTHQVLSPKAKLEQDTKLAAIQKSIADQQAAIKELHTAEVAKLQTDKQELQTTLTTKIETLQNMLDTATEQNKRAYDFITDVQQTVKQTSEILEGVKQREQAAIAAATRVGENLHEIAKHLEIIVINSELMQSTIEQIGNPAEQTKELSNLDLYKKAAEPVLQRLNTMKDKSAKTKAKEINDALETGDIVSIKKAIAKPRSFLARIFSSRVDSIKIFAEALKNARFQATQEQEAANKVFDTEKAALLVEVKKLKEQTIADSQTLLPELLAAAQARGKAEGSAKQEVKDEKIAENESTHSIFEKLAALLTLTSSKLQEQEEGADKVDDKIQQQRTLLRNFDNIAKEIFKSMATLHTNLQHVQTKITALKDAINKPDVSLASIRTLRGEYEKLLKEARNIKLDFAMQMLAIPQLLTRAQELHNLRILPQPIETLRKIFGITYTNEEFSNEITANRASICKILKALLPDNAEIQKLTTDMLENNAAVNKLRNQLRDIKMTPVQVLPPPARFASVSGMPSGLDSTSQVIAELVAPVISSQPIPIAAPPATTMEGTPASSPAESPIGPSGFRSGTPRPSSPTSPEVASSPGQGQQT